MFFIAPDAFEVAFGTDWRQAGVYAQWMMPWIYFQFISSPLSPIFTILEKQNQGMQWQFLLIFLRGSALFLGALTGDILLTVIYFSTASAIGYFVQIFWLCALVRSRKSKIILNNLKALTCSIVVSMPIMVLLNFEQINVTLLFVGFVVSLMMLGVYLFYVFQDARSL